MTSGESADGRAGIDAALVERLIAAQFPQWRGLPVRPVAVDGWDNRTYRLGQDMTVRLPTAAGYVPAVEKENAWLPVLAPYLPVPVPPVLGKGEPGEGYPYGWSVRGWLDGETATTPDRIGDLTGFAVALGGFLRALQDIDPAGGPAAGAHSFHRGAPPAYYDGETRAALAELDGLVDTKSAAAVWDAALAADFTGPPVWFHGDIAGGNLLVKDGRLAAVIDFGTSGVGDPACDLVISWTLFSGESRAAFRRTVAKDPGTWARARGWALWKALICMVQFRETAPALAAEHGRVIGEVLADAESADAGPTDAP
ncbi:aminoglycoside phosphotransferase family protein [Streptomyces sp. NBC_01477]|uniref:aminoglycoside phosphotransferase family protein n=1 Tax=Streptomyces sp. NBC_01477 TaxID=2976015 RepID=UPI002E377E6A|nr:aminoglycoside phosphotransferase family protein [Streptomyces sp. NBC_01477]